MVKEEGLTGPASFRVVLLSKVYNAEGHLYTTGNMFFKHYEMQYDFEHYLHHGWEKALHSLGCEQGQQCTLVYI